MQRKVTAATVPLPLTIRRALDQIAADLGDMPRECVRDVQELCLWKARLARRIRGVQAMRVPISPALVTRVEVSVVSSNDNPKPARRSRRASRTITVRNGRSVQVELRQLEMWH